ncbi:membrane hypothetical protein [Desulfamplus magnetovallimortis]|uniref:Peptidase M50 n=1 Tax=Desulfamplus magnetovallimortis TaxID=1246637 RepID=A0A1W1H6X7_9BACT|nr:site-2 protease family protein [Desulfamplus magnetovallimortis]SLM28209.1 membrane hypothetical protein [Desulfamplus magnetovallimortis]
MDWIYIAAVLTTLLGSVPVIIIYKMSSMRLLKGDITAISKDDIPPEQCAVLSQGYEFAKKYGFEFQAYVTRPPVIHGQPWGMYGALYLHRETNTSVLIYVEPMKHPVFEWRMSLVTPCMVDVADENAHALSSVHTPISKGKFHPCYKVTLNGSEFNKTAPPKDYDLHDAVTPFPEEQWEFHKKLLKSEKNENLKSCVNNGDEKKYSSYDDEKNSTYVEKNSIHEADHDNRFYDMKQDEALKAHESVFFQGLVETGILKQSSEGVYHLPAKLCLHIWNRNRVIQGTLLSRKAKEVKPSVQVSDPSESQYVSYQTYKKIQQSNSRTWLSKTIILLVTVLFFSFAFGLSFSWDFLWMLLLVLFIHEGGHLLGMWLFGYKDLKVLFIPFMGALATGRKDKISAWQEALILLFGPAPGYIAAVALLCSGITGFDSWLFDLAILSLTLNLINLLPFIPMDGGRIVNLALFNRLPGFQLILNLVSIAAFISAWLYWNEHVAMVLAAILLISLPNILKERIFLKHLFKHNAHKSGKGVRELIKILNSHKAWNKLIPQKQWQLLDSLSYRVQHANAGFVSSISIFIIWISIIVLPPLFSCLLSFVVMLLIS